MSTRGWPADAASVTRALAACGDERRRAFCAFFYGLMRRCCPAGAPESPQQALQWAQSGAAWRRVLLAFAVDKFFPPPLAR